MAMASSQVAASLHPALLLLRLPVVSSTSSQQDGSQTGSGPCTSSHDRLRFYNYACSIPCSLATLMLLCGVTHSKWRKFPS